MLSAAKKAIDKLGILVGFLIILSISHEFLTGFKGVAVRNIGISFGGQFPFLLITEGLFCLGCLAFYIKKRKWSWLLMTAGGLVNLSDRLRFGYVRDYWNLGGSGIYNNINDWIIALGVILFLIDALWNKSK